jgi:anti-sigma regulatory factor (Ser/Thr protein kinase)
MVTSTLKDLPEEKRLLIRSATQRMTDIANQLLKKGGLQEAQRDLAQFERSSESVMLIPLLDIIASEHRIRARDRIQLEIRCEFDLGYGFFALLDPTEFSRAISNLINNSVEAISDSGLIRLEVNGSADRTTVTIEDNGKGIPDHVLARLGQRGVSYGKENLQSGSGLGFYQAIKAVERFGGSLRVTSKVDIGTKIVIDLPRSEPPPWFTDQICLSTDEIVISVDDDQTIHQIWANRLAHESAAKFDHLTFSSIEQLEYWQSVNPDARAKYLIDFEFLGRSRDGLDAIERLGIAKDSFLVTSHIDEKTVRERAGRLGVKIIPKSLAPFIPLTGTA